MRQLKSLILECRVLYRSQQCSIFWHAALLYVANAVLNDPKDPERYLYFIICVDSYRNLFRSFVLFEGLVQALLTMAIDKHAITKREARLIDRKLRSLGHRPEGAKRARGGYIVDLDLAMTDNMAANVDTLADRFEDLAVFDEFTEGIL